MIKEANPTDWKHTLTEMSQRLASLPLGYQPGEKWLYSAAVDVSPAAAPGRAQQLDLLLLLLLLLVDSVVAAGALDPLEGTDVERTSPRTAPARLPPAPRPARGAGPPVATGVAREIPSPPPRARTTAGA